MIDFAELRRAKALQQEVVQRPPATVAQTVTTSQADPAEAAYLLKPTVQWDWQDLRNYVVAEATKRFGEQIRDPKKEAGIFKGFIGRHGIADAVLIAQAAFEVYEGTWRQAPITVTRFTQGNDPYFANVILARLKG